MNGLVDRLLGEIDKGFRRVVVIGDVMVDRWVHGHIAACQDGCRKFVQDRVVETPGGAANAERSISRWGNDTSLFGQSKMDAPVKCRYVEGDRIVFRADSNEDAPLVVGYGRVRDAALVAVASADAILLSDYDKGFLTPIFIREVVAACRECGIPCVADCKRRPDIYGGCVLKCNGDYQTKYNRVLCDHLDDGYLVVTTGSMNPLIWDNGSLSGLGYDLPSVPCVNHVGAGDCFAAHLTIALAYGFSIKDAVALAHSAGRVYVQYHYNRPPKPDEVAADLMMLTKVPAIVM